MWIANIFRLLSLFKVIHWSNLSRQYPWINSPPEYYFGHCIINIIYTLALSSIQATKIKSISRVYVRSLSQRSIQSQFKTYVLVFSRTRGNFQSKNNSHLILMSQVFAALACISRERPLSYTRARKLTGAWNSKQLEIYTHAPRTLTSRMSHLVWLELVACWGECYILRMTDVIHFTERWQVNFKISKFV